MVYTLHWNEYVSSLVWQENKNILRMSEICLHNATSKIIIYSLFFAFFSQWQQDLGWSLKITECVVTEIENKSYQDKLKRKWVEKNWEEVEWEEGEAN